MNRHTKIILGMLTAVLLMAALGGVWWSKTADARVEKKLDLAIKYLSENKYEEAILAYNDVIKIDNKEVKAYQGLGKVYTLQGKYDDARNVYEKGIKVVAKADVIKLSLGLAGMYIDQGDMVIAEKAYKEIIAKDKTCIEAYQGLAVLFLQQGDNAKAVAALEEAAKINPSDSRAYSNLAGYYVDANNQDKAFEYIAKSLLLDMNQSDSYQLLQKMYGKDWTELVGKLPGPAEQNVAQMMEFYARYENQQYKNAIAIYNEQLSQHTNNYKAAILTAICMVQSGDNEQATKMVKDFNEAKLNTWTMVDLARYYLQTGKKDIAIEWANKSLNINDHNLYALKLLAEIYTADKNPLANTIAARAIVYDYLPLITSLQELRDNQIPVSIKYELPVSQKPEAKPDSITPEEKKEAEATQPVAKQPDDTASGTQPDPGLFKKYASQGRIPENQFVVGTPMKVILDTLGPPDEDIMERAGICHLKYGNTFYQYCPYINWAMNNERKLDIRDTSLAAVVVTPPTRAFGIDLDKVTLKDIEKIFGKTKYGISFAATEGYYLSYEFSGYIVYFVGAENGKVYSCKIFAPSAY